MGYKFIVGNGLAILLIAIGMGFLGGAEDFTSDELVIGDAEELVETGEIQNSSQVDFDTNRLIPRINLDEITEFQGDVQGYTWSGQGTNGSLTYNVSGVDEIGIVSQNPGLFSDNMFVIVRGTDNGQSFEDRLNLNSEDNLIVLEGELFDYSVNELEIFITSQDSQLLGFKETTLQIDDATNVRNIQEVNLDVQAGFFEKIGNLLTASGQALNAVVGVFVAWIAFIWIMPGIIGWFLKGYIAILIAYFVIEELWPF